MFSKTGSLLRLLNAIFASTIKKSSTTVSLKRPSLKEWHVQNLFFDPYLALDNHLET